MLAALPVASGPVAPKNTATPDPIAIAEVLSTVKLESAEVDGVTYKYLVPSDEQAGTPLSVKPVPKAVAVCANSPLRI